MTHTPRVRASQMRRQAARAEQEEYSRAAAGPALGGGTSPLPKMCDKRLPYPHGHGRTNCHCLTVRASCCAALRSLACSPGEEKALVQPLQAGATCPVRPPCALTTPQQQLCAGLGTPLPSLCPPDVCGTHRTTTPLRCALAHIQPNSTHRTRGVVVYTCMAGRAMLVERVPCPHMLASHARALVKEQSCVAGSGTGVCQLCATTRGS